MTIPARIVVHGLIAAIIANADINAHGYGAAIHDGIGSFLLLIAQIILSAVLGIKCVKNVLDSIHMPLPLSKGLLIPIMALDVMYVYFAVVLISLWPSSCCT